MPQNRDEHESPFDLDAALEEKFQSVQHDLNRFLEMNQSAKKASQQHDDDKSKTNMSDSNDIPAKNNIDLSTEPSLENKTNEDEDKKEETDNELIKERKKRYKLKRQIIITNRIGSVVRIFAIGTIIFAGSIFFLVGARPTESAEENRKLASLPSFSWNSLIDGTYISNLMTYYEDTVPGRSTFKKLISKLESFQGLQGEEQVRFYGNISKLTPSDEDIEKQNSVTSTTVSIATGSTMVTSTTVTEATNTQEAEAKPIEIGDGIVLVDKRAISIYGGSLKRGEAYASCINKYKQELGENVNVYSLIAPTAVSFYLPESYSSYTGSEIDNINHINQALQNVKIVDAYSALDAHVNEEIYARTDHHWTPLGAYYAAEAFAETADVPFAPLSNYSKTTLSGYLGSMYTFTKSAVLQENPEEFTYFSPKNKYSTQYYDTDFTNERNGRLLITLDNIDPVSWYLVFMGGDEKITHVKTDVTNQRTLVIVKDSYGNALVPCLTQSFSEIYIIDMRYFDLNAVSFMKQVGATDVLFAMNTFSATGSNSECLETIRTQ